MRTPSPRSGWPTVRRRRPGMPTNGNCASPICCAIRNTPSTAATPASLRASTSSCNAPSASASVAPISRTAPRPVPRRPRPPARSAARGDAYHRGRTKARPSHPQMPRRSLPFRHPSRCPRHQQRLRTGAAAQRHLPQSNGRLSLHLGRPNLCRRRFGNRHRQAARPFSSPSPPSCPRRSTHPHPALIRGEQLPKAAQPIFMGRAKIDSRIW